MIESDKNGDGHSVKGNETKGDAQCAIGQNLVELGRVSYQIVHARDKCSRAKGEDGKYGYERAKEISRLSPVDEVATSATPCRFPKVA